MTFTRSQLKVHFQKYQNLYQKCWNEEPKSRPDIEEKRENSDNGFIKPEIDKNNITILSPEIKKEKVVVDEKIGQKRVNKEELSRGTISSEGSEDSSESENGETILEGKKQIIIEEAKEEANGQDVDVIEIALIPNII
ncbi:hypothetical protein RhiirA4_463468 [Rhizophagus irregularis]|uniref:Uncharacterized protein n=1 Tax=Rhizophagus irregularis TaxID=588596 RepID=A0A2I1GN06_9GLOM|nr:hypothetical protein RhiirA4_463468 [Rhizophagus irregularis]